MIYGLKLKIQEKKKQSGQVVLILLLVMIVALAIGLSVVQRSLTDVSTSTRIEQSSRAFSAAEAGIERVLQNGDPSALENVINEDAFGNNASAIVRGGGLLPNQKQAIEYPPVSKEEIVHVWLADPDANFESDIGAYYTQSELEVYFGSTETFIPADRPAVELIIISLNKTGDKKYTSKKILLDFDINDIRPSNNFLKPRESDDNVKEFRCSDNPDTAFGVKTIFSESGENDRKFACRAVLQNLSPTLVLLRARILYSSVSHPFAVKPVTTSEECESDADRCSLPRQVRIIQSSGTSGDAQRTIQLFRIEKVVPFYLDYAIFSAGDINK